ncbi:MAG TPA: hypothetical protein VJR24_14145 [Gemmatimonadaceae bacterium]|nr:hypothetical protein [Gemmatimonadaceae bacterium]
MFVRFVVHHRHAETDMPMGIFEAVELLPRVGQLPDWDERRLEEIREWFVAHLPQPTRVARSARPNGAHRALSWFKASACEHIAQARELAAVLERHDILTEVLQTNRPGYIVYEDEFQVLAEPFRSEVPDRAI